MIEKFTKMIAYMFTFYGRELNQEQLKQWAMLFINQDIDFEVFKEACNQVVINEEFLNSPATINKYIPKLNAYQIILDVIHKYGTANDRYVNGYNEDGTIKWRYTKDMRDNYLLHHGGYGMIALYNDYVKRIDETKQEFKSKLEREINESYTQNKANYKKRDLLEVENRPTLSIPKRLKLLNG